MSDFRILIKRVLGAVISGAWFLSASAASAQPNYLHEVEKRLGTDSKLDRSFHVVVDEPQGFGLRVQGLIVGIEKSRRSILGVMKLKNDLHLRAKPDSFNETERSKLAARLNDGKRTFISHIVESNLDPEAAIPYMRNLFLYDAYGDSPRRPSQASWGLSGADWYEQSWEALGKLEGHIETMLRDANTGGKAYTHVIVMTMGWNTPQEKAIRNINSLAGNLLIAAGKGFKPLFIAITWPSSWNAPLVSLKNKADDADEIGYVWANALLNRHLGGLRARSSPTSWPPFRIVAIGHSLGARLVTRAAFSGEVLNPPVPLEEGVDLVISLEGAFSANRFLAERSQGREGAPYADYRKLRGAVVLTWSDSDDANPLANYITGANYVGGKLGHKRAQDYPDHFTFVDATEDGKLKSDLVDPEKPKAVKLIDASELIRYSVLGAGGGSHSDIYNAYLGRLTFEIISRLAP